MAKRVTGGGAWGETWGRGGYGGKKLSGVMVGGRQRRGNRAEKNCSETRPGVGGDEIDANGGKSCTGNHNNT